MCFLPRGGSGHHVVIPHCPLNGQMQGENRQHLTRTVINEVKATVSTIPKSHPKFYLFLSVGLTFATTPTLPKRPPSPGRPLPTVPSWSAPAWTARCACGSQPERILPQPHPPSFMGVHSMWLNILKGYNFNWKGV